MDSLVSGDKVEHPDYGYGEITLLVGSRAVVNFSGEKIEVDTEQLSATSRRKPPVIANPSLDGNGLISFRRAFEAVNIGVVPPDPGALRDLTIEGDASTREIGEWLSGAYTNGLCKAVFGFYGAGKSHFLHLAKMTALESGWVVSYLEFDPKAADPAKAHLVYQSLMANLEFPARANGDIAKGFTGLIREARESWERVRDLRLFRASPWFLKALEVLLYYPHSDDQDYLDACLWVAGDGGTFSVMRQLARDQGLRPGFVPAMPRTRETAEIYTMHLAVVAEMCRALGYQGLLLILDEAEHVRGYNVRRQERANNFFDLLARCAHRPVSGDAAPILNDHGYDLPDFWRGGPHFGLLVGLTEGDTFSNPDLSLREACAFLFNANDRVMLRPPTSTEYEAWCATLFEKFHLYYAEQSELLRTVENRRALAALLREEFEQTREDERVLRIWVKLACLVPSVLMVKQQVSLDELSRMVRSAARQSARPGLPWEDDVIS